MHTRDRMLIGLLSLLLVAGLIAGQSAKSALQSINLTSPNGNVIAQIYENAPFAIISQTDSSQQIQITGWADSDVELHADPMAALENIDGIYYDDLQFQESFGNSIRLIGVFHNRTDNCFASIRVEASLWNSNGNLQYVDQFTAWQIPASAIVPFRSDRIFATLENAENLALRMRFLEGSDCTGALGGGGGGGIDNQ